MKLLKTLKTSAVILSALFVYLTFFYSCKKEATSEILIGEDQQKLLDWYNTNVSQDKWNPFASLNPNWDLIHIKEVNGQIIYEVSMNNPNKVFIGDEYTDKNMAEKMFLRNDTRLLIFENKKSGLLENGCYMSIINTGTQNNVKSVHYKEPANLTGNILYFNPDGKMANGWSYLDGATLNIISVSNETEYKSMIRLRIDQALLSPDSNKTRRYEAAYCTPEYRIIYGTSCTGVEGYMNCQQYVVGREYVNNCEYGGGGDEGGYTPPKPTGGGGSSSGSAPRELKTDSLKKKFPCADKLILQPIFKLPEMSDFVAPFLTNMKPTITYQTAELAWNNNKTYMLGKTIHDPTSGLNQSTIITLNEKMLENSSPLLIATTVIHETLHSYIYYNVATAESPQSVSTYKNANWLASLNGFYLMRNLPANYSNHSLMLSSYFDKAVGVLRKWADQQSTTYTDKQLAMAMLFGLNTVDDNTPKASIDAIKEMYDAKMKQIGTTQGELNSFTLEHLNSPTKLSTSGCN